MNITVSYNTEDYGVSSTAYYNSGTPYTWTPISESPLYRVNLSPNNSSMPSQLSVDLSAFYTLWKFNNYKLQITMLAYNIFDALNEYSVYSRTGKAYTDIVRSTDISSHRSDFNDYYDVIHDPSMYAAPRSVKLGITFSFSNCMKKF